MRGSVGLRSGATGVVCLEPSLADYAAAAVYPISTIRQWRRNRSSPWLAERSLALTRCTLTWRSSQNSSKETTRTLRASGAARCDRELKPPVLCAAPFQQRGQACGHDRLNRAQPELILCFDGRISEDEGRGRGRVLTSELGLNVQGRSRGSATLPSQTPTPPEARPR